MSRRNRNFHLIALALILSLASVALAQENATGEPVALKASANTRNVPDGQKFKVKGIVIKSNADSFTLREPDGTETVVSLTDTTKIKAAKKNWFRLYKAAGPSSILRGLRLEAEGKGNQAGELVAAKIRFDEDDFRTAQALEARVDPVETMATSTKVLAEANEQRISSAEQNAERLAGQVTELSAVAAAANDAAGRAQASADRAQASADSARAEATDRINAIDDYLLSETFMVHFRSGSAVLSSAAKAQIDAAAAKVQNENLKGWVIEITGYADSKGNTERNRSLSERRADAVINYLVTTYNLPLRRLVQPFGYGEQNPVADNASGEGRALNRRGEIKVLVSKGLSAQVSQ
ncbi:MAG TPA: OmpA family protein [Pyrinomonadaceae bacterium]|nr:OmpA family protein [Pyrinomonadaceae bacterium]